MNPNEKFELMLKAAYEYYHEFNNIMMDHEYDKLTREVSQLQDQITHKNKDLVDFDSLKRSSSLFYIPLNAYKQIVGKE
jgi:NAD-dependent DNA ligase